MSYLIGLFVLYNAPNLEEFGIYKGASTPEDDNRELTDDEKRDKIMSVLDTLPPEMQNMFKGVLQQTDPVRSSQLYEKQIQQEIMRQEMQSGYYGDTRHSRFYEDILDDEAWNQQQRDIFEMNRMSHSDPSRRFDVNDWT